MRKFASCLVGLGLTALVLSGCAAASAAGNDVAVGNAAGDSGGLGTAPSLPVDPPSEFEIATLPASKFADAVGPVLEAFPDDYAFFYFDSEQQPVLGFSDEPVASVMDAVISTGQPAQIVENTGFTQTQYRATAEQVIADLQTTWPEDVPFPMIDVRPDLGVGAIGAILVTEDDSTDAARSTQRSTHLVQDLDIDSPFSIRIDEENSLGELAGAAD